MLIHDDDESGFGSLIQKVIFTAAKRCGRIQIKNQKKLL